MKLTFNDELKENRTSVVMGRGFSKCLLGEGLSRGETKELFKAFGDYLEIMMKRECSSVAEYHQIEKNNADYQSYVEFISQGNNNNRVC